MVAWWLQYAMISISCFHPSFDAIIDTEAVIEQRTNKDNKETASAQQRSSQPGYGGVVREAVCLAQMNESASNACRLHVTEPFDGGGLLFRHEGLN